MQIWKSHYMFVFIEKTCPENFAYLILKIFDLLTREVFIFHKNNGGYFLLCSIVSVCL